MPQPQPTTTTTTDPVALAARPLTGNCRRILATRAHACFGISPFNSRFSTAYIAQLARWGLGEFDAVHFFVPDLPAAFTLEALGYPADRAARKARRQGQYVRNKIWRALRGFGIPEPGPLILDGAALGASPVYLSLLTAAHELFEYDPAFAAAALEASYWVLDKRQPSGASISTEQVRAAVRYFLAELPLFTDTAAIVERAASVFCYHQSLPFLERLYQGGFAWKPAASQGFVVLELERESAIGDRPGRGA